MDQCKAQATNDAAVVRGGDAVEGMFAKGVYKTELLRPRADSLAGYLRIRDAIDALQSRILLKLDDLAELARLQGQMRDYANVVWADDIGNVVCTQGKNVALDAFLGTGSYSAVGPYIGLVSSVSWSSAVAADTMASHGGWLEAGGSNAPTYTAPRKTAAWNAAANGTKGLSSNASFGMIGTGTAKGCFMLYGAGALTTIDNTAGSLLSVGTFSGGDKVVGSGDTINVSYSLAL